MRSLSASSSAGGFEKVWNEWSWRKAVPKGGAAFRFVISARALGCAAVGPAALFARQTGSPRLRLLLSAPSGIKLHQAITCISDTAFIRSGNLSLTRLQPLVA